MNAPTPAVVSVTADDPLLRADEGGVATLTLNRPRQFNAIDHAMLDRLQAELDAIAGDAAVRVVVIRGAGSAFSGGHDLKEMMSNRTEAFVGDLFARCSRMMQSLQSLPQPVIARVHGIATAAGCQLVAACDLAVAANDARFATSGVNYGLFCSTPAVPLSRSILRKRAFEMLVMGDFIDAATALDWGLVNRVVPVRRISTPRSPASLPVSSPSLARWSPPARRCSIASSSSRLRGPTKPRARRSRVTCSAPMRRRVSAPSWKSASRTGPDVGCWRFLRAEAARVMLAGAIVASPEPHSEVARWVEVS